MPFRLKMKTLQNPINMNMSRMEFLIIKKLYHYFKKTSNKFFKSEALKRIFSLLIN